MIEKQVEVAKFCLDAGIMEPDISISRAWFMILKPFAKSMLDLQFHDALLFESVIAVNSLVSLPYPITFDEGKHFSSCFDRVLQTKGVQEGLSAVQYLCLMLYPATHVRDLSFLNKTMFDRAEIVADVHNFLDEIDLHFPFKEQDCQFNSSLHEMFKMPKSYSKSLTNSLKQQLHSFHKMSVDASILGTTVKERTSTYLNYWSNFNISHLAKLRFLALTVGIGLPSSALSESLFSKAKHQHTGPKQHPETLSSRLRLKVLLEDNYLTLKFTNKFVKDKSG